MHHCRPYRPVNPLTGIWAPRGNALYRYASPDGDGRSCGISTTHPLARHSATQFVIRGHDLPQLCGGNSSDHCSLITDYSYVYCANNPVKCVDPNGEEIILCFYLGKKGESSSKLLAKIINKGLEGQFKTRYTKTKVNGSIRGQDKYENRIYKTTYSKNERSTTYSYSVSEPIIKVNKSW